MAQGRILDITKNGEHLFAGRRGSNPQASIRKDVLKKNIAHFWMNVKWESEKIKFFRQGRRQQHRVEYILQFPERYDDVLYLLKTKKKPNRGSNPSVRKRYLWEDPHLAS